jgi:hypothetical protein
MPSLPNQSSYIPNVVPTGEAACEGRKSITTLIDFSIGLIFRLDLTAIQAQQQWIRSVQTIFVDNSENAVQIVVTCGVTLQRVVIPPNSQAYIPLLQPNPPVLQFEASAAVPLTVQILNFFLPPCVWGTNGSPAIDPDTGALIVTDQILDSCVANNALNVNSLPFTVNGLIDASGTIVTGGTAQSLFAANPDRQRFIITNPTSATEILQFAIGLSTAGYIDLAAGATWDENGSSIAGQQIFIKGATTGHAFTAYSA